MADKESLRGATLEVDAGLWVVSGEAFELRPGTGVDLDSWGGKLSEFFAEVLAVKSESSCTALSEFINETYNLILLLP